MKKIPTLFLRTEDRRYVIDQINPGCEWVIEGEGQATRKYDGTCVMFDGTAWWARREVKPGKAEPDGFVQVDHDEVTGKRMGWEPMPQSGFAEFHAEAADVGGGWEPGTYELVGPKVNGNPERMQRHVLIPHGNRPLNLPPRLDYRTVQRIVSDLAAEGIEGIVWHHPDGRMAKMKGKDFRVDATQVRWLGGMDVAEFPGGPVVWQPNPIATAAADEIDQLRSSLAAAGPVEGGNRFVPITEPIALFWNDNLGVIRGGQASDTRYQLGYLAPPSEPKPWVKPEAAS